MQPANIPNTELIYGVTVKYQAKKHLLFEIEYFQKVD